MKKRILIIAALVAVVLGLGVVVYSKVLYKDKWYNNTVVNGVDVSGKTIEESKTLLLKDMENYQLTIKGRNKGEMTVKASDIDLNVSFNKTLQETFDKEHDGISLPISSHEYEITYDTKYDSSKLSTLLDKSVLIAGNDNYKIVAPKDAYYAYSDEKHSVEIVKEVEGNTLDSKKFNKAVNTAISKLEETMDLTDEKTYKDIYEKPTLYADSEEAKSQLDTYNNAAVRYLKFDLTKSVSDEITPKEITKWIKISKKGKVKYDEDKVKAWVEKFCLKYKTEGTTRKFKSHTGKTLSISGGDYGWRIDYDKTCDQVLKALKKDTDSAKVQAYIKDQSEENKKAITTNLDINYTNTAYKMDLDNKANDYDTKNYTEVDLGAQRVYIFRKGKVAFSCPCISGRPVAKRKTTTGAFYIKEHQYYRVLKGDDYETPVNYWVRITWSGTGFHAAPWQSWGAWSPNYYKSRGSHGCVNLSTGNAATVYKKTKNREIVFMHY